jgi:hypothetical protein
VAGRRKVDDYHLQKGVTSGQEFTHDDLEKGLAFKITLILSELDIELLKHGGDGVLLEVHDSVENLEDGIKDELLKARSSCLPLASVPTVVHLRVAG